MIQYIENQADLHSIYERLKLRKSYGTKRKARNVEYRRTHIFQPGMRRTTNGNVDDNETDFTQSRSKWTGKEIDRFDEVRYEETSYPKLIKKYINNIICLSN